MGCDARDDCLYADIFIISNYQVCYLRGENCGDWQNHYYSELYHLYIKGIIIFGSKNFHFFKIMPIASNSSYCHISSNSAPRVQGDCWQGYQCDNCNDDFVGSINGLKVCCEHCEQSGIQLGPNYCTCLHNGKLDLLMNQYIYIYIYIYKHKMYDRIVKNRYIC